MKRKFFSTIAAVAALSFVTGLLGCSDDDSDPNYGSCSELAAVEKACEDKDYDTWTEEAACIGDSDFCKGLDVQSELSDLPTWEGLDSYTKCTSVVYLSTNSTCSSLE